MLSQISLMLIFFNIILKCDILEARLMKTLSFQQAVLAPVFTPYCEDDNSKLDLDKVDEMAKDYADKGVQGVLVAGKAGEGYLLGEDECKALYAAWVKAGRRYNLKVLVLVGDPTPVGIRLATYADGIGVDGILILLSLFHKQAHAQAALEDMKLITDRVKYTPVLLYDDPLTRPACLRIDELYYLATEHIPNFYGIRCGLEKALQIRAAGLYKPHQLILISNHYAISSVRCQDFNATVAVANNIVPGLAVATVNADCQEKAEEYQDRINKIVVASAISPRDYLPGMKAAYEIKRGIKIGGVRPPLKFPTCEDRRRITRKLQNLNVNLACPVRSCEDCDSDECDED